MSQYFKADDEGKRQKNPNNCI